VSDVGDVPHHLHKTLDLDGRDVVQVTVNTAAYVYLMDDENYALYLDDQEFEYYGGRIDRSPHRTRAPFAGIWHLVIEQVDPRIPMTAGVQVIA
jgi:hypothetical protein